MKPALWLLFAITLTVGLGQAAPPLATQLIVDYPLNGSVFPPEFPAPQFLWRDNSPAKVWRIEVNFGDGTTALRALSRGEPMRIGEIDKRAIAPTNKLPELTPQQTAAHTWRPATEMWTQIKRHSVDLGAEVSILGYENELSKVPVSSSKLTILTSKDPVGAPIFYRDVPLMSVETEPGVIKPIPPAAIPLIAWRLRNVGETTSRLLVDNLPTCANCHSFSRDGKTLGMDLDGPQNDKGLYALTAIKPQTEIRNEDVVSWSSFKGKLGGKLRVGFMSQVSPDGRFVVTTINGPDVQPNGADATQPKLLKGLQGNYYLANFRDYRFLQVFYPTRGILAWYSRETGKLLPLPGADDEAFVQSNVTWSPDGSYVVFARAKAQDPYPEGSKIAQFANDPNETQVRFDLYRLPFNNGRGGKAEPITGASANGMSNSFPKVSPDGKWIVYVQARNGLLMRPDSQLYIVPAAGGTPRRMNANTPLMNSWHSFSPNGRWLVFSSKSRSPYTQMFLTHIDENGNDTPAIYIENSTAANRAVNIPEFVNVAPDGFLKLSVPAAEYYRLSDRAQALRKSGDTAAAIATWRQALTLNPNDDGGHNSLGVLLATKGEFVAAETEFQTTLRLNPEFRDIHSNLAVALAGQGRLDEAVVEFEKALAADPRSIEAQNYYGRLLARRGETEKGMAHIRKALELDPTYPSAHINLGMALAQVGQLAESKSEFVKALESDPESAEAQNGLGLLAVRQGDMRAAIEAFRKTLQIDSEYPSARYNLGRALAEAGQFTEAAAELEKVLRANPKSAEAHSTLGTVLMPLRRVDEAMAQFQMAVDVDPNYAEAHFYLGAALRFMKGQTAKALVHWRKVIELDPDHVPALTQTAVILATHPDAALRNAADAVRFAQRAAELTAGQDPMILDILASAHAENGHFDEAVRVEQQALAAARAKRDAGMERNFQTHLALYESKTPLRERR
jgi:tetratricopeptide (TPR) repeat protein